MVRGCILVGGGEINMEFYLKRRIIISVILFMITIFFSVKIWLGKPIMKVDNHYNHSIIKIICKRLIPILMISVMAKYMIAPIVDVFDKNIYESIGVLNGVSSNSNKMSGDYPVKIGDTVYRMPKNLIHSSKLKKRYIYKFQYYKRSKLIYKIIRMSK